MPGSGIGGLTFTRRSALVFALALAGWTLLGHAQTRETFDALAARATAAREAGQPDEAIRAYRAALDVRPSWDEGWWYLGTILYDTDYFEEAIPALRRVVELHPNAGPAFAFLGLSEFETGDYRGAYSDLESARQLGFADSPDVEKVALYHLGLLFNLRGEFEKSADLMTSTFGPSHFSEQIKVALGLAFLRAPILPAQADPAKDALIHAAGEAAIAIANHDVAAARKLQQILRDHPDTPFVHYQYGAMLSAASRFPEAEAQFREEIGISPHSQAAYKALANVLQAEKKQEAAQAAMQRAHELADASSEVDAAQIATYSLHKASALADTAAKTTSTNGTAATFEELSRTADSELRAGRLDQAAVAYRQGLSLKPNWPEGWRQLGTISYMQARYADAVSAFHQSVTFETRQADAWTLLGLSEFELKDYKNSLIHLERGRALGFSGNATAVRISRYHLALLLNLNGDFDRALDLLIPEIAPGALSEEIQFAMGIALLRIPALPEQIQADQQALVRTAGEAGVLLSDSHYEKGLPILQNLLLDHPSTPFLHYAYGDALAATSLYDEAEAQLREETRLNPRSALPYIRLASIELTQHQSSNALADAKKAIALAPDSSEARYLLGRSYLEEGQIPEAIRELETARRTSPNSPKVRFNLARAYAKANRSTDAETERAEFERLNALLPGQKKSYGDRVARGSSEGESGRPPEK